MRVPAIEAALQQYATILRSLTEAQETCSSEVAARARGLHRRFGDGSMLVCLMIADDMLVAPLEFLNRSLQSGAPWCLYP